VAKRTVRGTDFLVQLGGRIRSLRQRRGWTQLRLAEEVGLHRSFIADVERGSRNISILNLLHIATALGISLAELLARLGSRPPSRMAGRPGARRS